MKPDQLLAHYDHIADAPDAVTRLRRYVLDLAMRGKLVEQDAGEEPASALLARISAQKQQLGIRNPPSVVSAKLFELPSGWVQASLIAYALDVSTGPFGSALHQSDYVTGGIPLVNPSHMINDRISPDINVSVTERTAAQLASYRLQAGDIVMARRGEVGRAAVVECHQAGWLCGTGSFFLRFSEEVHRPYFLLLMRSTEMRAYLLGNAVGTTMFNLNHGILKSAPLAIPPLAEQHRIVAKVDELMALCDRLEAARAAREATRDRLAAASLARLNSPDPETFQSDARFALDTLPSLTTRPDQIKRLRQTILGLAVRGKLATQHPSDEAGEALLAKVTIERARLLNSGYPNLGEARTQIKKIAEQRVPPGLPALPAGWVWATLQQCSLLVVDCKNKTAPYVSEGIRLVRTTNVKGGRLNHADQKYVDQATYESWSARCKPEPDDVLITREAPMGEVCLIPPGETVCLGQRMMLVRLVPKTLVPAFVLLSLRDPSLMNRVRDKPIGATVQHLRVGGVETLLMPLPPLSEQHRIVAKVDELMALCDRLEATLTTASDTRRRALEALLVQSLRVDDEHAETC